MKHLYLASIVMMLFFTSYQLVYTVEAQNNNLYLPLIVVTNSRTLISGKVTMSGVPAEGVTVDLYKQLIGSPPKFYSSTITQQDGSYQFWDVAPLSTDAFYYALFSSGRFVDPNRLGWVTYLWTLNEGQHIILETVDMANVVLLSPSTGSNVSFPITFSWTPRPGHPNESYQLVLREKTMGANVWWTDPLGYVSSYTLNGLPQGVSVGENYSWLIYVCSPQNGWGIGSTRNTITFNSGGSGSVPKGSVGCHSVWGR